MLARAECGAQARQTKAVEAELAGLSWCGLDRNAVSFPKAATVKVESESRRDCEVRWPSVSLRLALAESEHLWRPEQHLSMSLARHDSSDKPSKMPDSLRS